MKLHKKQRGRTLMCDLLCYLSLGTLCSALGDANLRFVPVAPTIADQFLPLNGL